MFDLIRAYQLEIMGSLSAVCMAIALFVIISKSVSRKRKRALLYLELGAAALLQFDRLAYMYRGVEGSTGYIMVHVSNFMVFSLILFELYAFNYYMSDLIQKECGYETKPFRLRFVEVVLLMGEGLIVLSQFNGMYYSFDTHNRYTRGSLFIICYAIPLFVFFIELSAIVQMTRKLRKGMRISLFAFASAQILASFIQLFAYGISLTNMTMALMVIVLYIFALLDTNYALEKANELKLMHFKSEQESMMRLFDQTATAFVGAMEAKDEYATGRAKRVAQYARELAELNGKSEEVCSNVYYAALLHDVDSDILLHIKEYPFLSIGARYYHENFDGSGYPEKLSGNDIPEIARIIKIADAYDRMTSKQELRDALPQQKVREEIVKNTGTLYDPEYAKIMLHMIDLDPEYKMHESAEVHEFVDGTEIACGSYRDTFSDGIGIKDAIVKIHFQCTPKKNFEEDICMPAIVLFDSLDARVHSTKKEIESMNYFEYGEIWLDGHSVASGARVMKVDYKELGSPDEVDGAGVAVVKSQKEVFDGGESIDYDLEVVRVKDHLQLTMECKYATMKAIVALTDNARFSYMAFTGEHCYIDNVHVVKTEEVVSEDYIPRIASEVSFINRMEGDIPNIQVDGYRTAYTKGVEVTDGMEINFHAMSLPTARLVWHCPFINLFYSDDKQPVGDSYREYAMIRLDGESWETGDFASNKVQMRKREFFTGWDAWKENCKAGYDSSVIIRRKGNKITTVTSNNGIDVRNVTTINDGNRTIYVSLTGDQVALTDIRIRA